MNFKHLFPTFRNRYRFVESRLKTLSAAGYDFAQALNLGTGEGDYDRMIAAYCRELTACDINPDDVAHAARLNNDVLNLRYEVNDALALSYPDAHFDLAISCEVIEHVGDTARMLSELGRVLKPGGIAIMTFPSHEFPFTYDPINRIGQWLGRDEYLISQGAYAFGHEYLIRSDRFRREAQKAGLRIREWTPLSGYLSGLLEMYWTGWVQALFKKNNRNLTEQAEGRFKIRPNDARPHALARITDAIIALDRTLFLGKGNSVGKGVMLERI